MNGKIDRVVKILCILGVVANILLFPRLAFPASLSLTQPVYSLDQILNRNNTTWRGIFSAGKFVGFFTSGDLKFHSGFATGEILISGGVYSATNTAAMADFHWFDVGAVFASDDMVVLDDIRLLGSVYASGGADFATSTVGTITAGAIDVHYLDTGVIFATDNVVILDDLDVLGMISATGGIRAATAALDAITGNSIDVAYVDAGAIFATSNVVILDDLDVLGSISATGGIRASTGTIDTFTSGDVTAAHVDAGNVWASGVATVAELESAKIDIGNMWASGSAYVIGSIYASFGGFENLLATASAYIYALDSADIDVGHLDAGTIWASGTSTLPDINSAHVDAGNIWASGTVTGNMVTGPTGTFGTLSATVSAVFPTGSFDNLDVSNLDVGEQWTGPVYATSTIAASSTISTDANYTGSWATITNNMAIGNEKWGANALLVEARFATATIVGYNDLGVSSVSAIGVHGLVGLNTAAGYGRGVQGQGGLSAYGVYGIAGTTAGTGTYGIGRFGIVGTSSTAEGYGAYGSFTGAGFGYGAWLQKSDQNSTGGVLRIDGAQNGIAPLTSWYNYRTPVANMTASGTLYASGSIEPATYASVGTYISAGGAITAGGKLTADSATVTNSITAGGDIAATGDVIADGLRLTGSASTTALLADSAHIYGKLTVDGDIDPINYTGSGNINASGGAYIGTEIHTASMTVTAKSNLESATVTNSITAGGDVGITGDLSADDIDGASATISGPLEAASATINGPSWFASASVQGNLDVYGDAYAENFVGNGSYLTGIGENDTLQDVVGRGATFTQGIEGRNAALSLVNHQGSYATFTLQAFSNWTGDGTQGPYWFYTGAASGLGMSLQNAASGNLTSLLHVKGAAAATPTQLLHVQNLGSGTAAKITLENSLTNTGTSLVVVDRSNMGHAAFGIETGYDGEAIYGDVGTLNSWNVDFVDFQRMSNVYTDASQKTFRIRSNGLIQSVGGAWFGGAQTLDNSTQSQPFPNPGTVSVIASGFATPAVVITGDVSAGTNTLQIRDNQGAALVTFEADGTLAFASAATVFEDVRVAAGQMYGATSSVPSRATLNGGVANIFAFDNGGATDVAYFQVQMPHNYKLGSDIYPHIHWTPVTDSAAAEYVLWELDCDVATSSVIFASYTTMWASATVGSAAQWKNIKTDFKCTSDYTSWVNGSQPGCQYEDQGFFEGSSLTTVSAQFACRLQRAQAIDTYHDFAGLLEVDFHYEIDTLGSRTISTK